MSEDKVKSYEIVSLGPEWAAGSTLLFAPIEGSGEVLETRAYQFTYRGEEGALDDFVDEVLLDPITQGLGQAVEGAQGWIDICMRAGVLDLEKEAILERARRHPADDLEILGLTLWRRVYYRRSVVGAAPYVKDLANPAIHRWEVRDA
jgi:hypothetical protein